jgi:hypothetical protein
MVGLPQSLHQCQYRASTGGRAGTGASTSINRWKPHQFTGTTWCELVCAVVGTVLTLLTARELDNLFKLKKQTVLSPCLQTVSHAQISQRHESPALARLN